MGILMMLAKPMNARQMHAKPMHGKLLAGFFALAISAASLAVAGPQHAAQLGRTYLAEGEAVAAAKSFAEQQRMAPYDAVALNNLGVAKVAAGDYLMGLDYIARAQKIAPQRTDIQENLANLREWVKLYSTPPEEVMLADANVPQEPPPLWPAATQQARMQPVEDPSYQASQSNQSYQRASGVEKRGQRSTSKACKRKSCK
jgi:tetratricopeptide (TPR) repeat protein